MTASQHERDHADRKDNLVRALRTFRDVGETLQRGDAGGKFVPSSKLLQMPNAWHDGCYAELEIQLAVLARFGRNHYWQIAERYLRSERLQRRLVKQGHEHFEAERHEVFVAGESHFRYSLGARLPRNVEVLREVREPRAVVTRKKGETQGILVNASLERWDERVDAGILDRALDTLLGLMPRWILLPREVLAVA